MKELSKEIFGETPAYFNNALVNALNKEEKPVKHKRFTFVLIAAVLIFALACTALAVGLNRNAKYEAMKIARDTLMTRYGITNDTIAFFESDITTEDGAFSIVFHAVKFNFDAIGEYVVRIKDGEEVAASWTHDDVDPSVYASGQLDAAVWGPVQLEAALAVERAYRANQAAINQEHAGEWTLEELAAMDQVYADASSLGIDIWVMRVAPSADDITKADAYDMAKEAIIQKYGVTMETLEKYDYSFEYLKYQSNEEPTYRFYITLEHGNANQEFFIVSISSPSGTVVECDWLVDPKYRTLPTGSLVAYEDAIREFVKDKALAEQTVASQADISKRIIEAGYGKYLDGKQYILPGDSDITEQDALEAAKAAMFDTYGFTDETLSLFASSQSFQLLNQQPAWVIVYNPTRDNKWLIEWYDKLGTYEVILVADTGEINQISWSLQEERGSIEYTEHTWGQSQAFDATMLHYLQQIYDESKLVLQKYEEMFEETLTVPSWTMEELAAYDQLFRDAGFDATRYRHGLPDQKAIPLEEAIQIAMRALKEEYSVTDIQFEGAYMETEYWVAEPDQPTWRIRYFIMDDGRQDDYGVLVNAYTGEIVNIGYTGMGNG